MSIQVVCDQCGYVDARNNFRDAMFDRQWIVTTDPANRRPDHQFCSYACLAAWSTKIAAKATPGPLPETEAAA